MHDPRRPVGACVCASLCQTRRSSLNARFANVYEGDQVPPGKRSLALRVLMSSAERTLNDKDIATVRARIVGALEREFGATLR